MVLIGWIDWFQMLAAQSQNQPAAEPASGGLSFPDDGPDHDPRLGYFMTIGHPSGRKQKGLQRPTRLAQEKRSGGHDRRNLRHRGQHQSRGRQGHAQGGRWIEPQTRLYAGGISRVIVAETQGEKAATSPVTEYGLEGGIGASSRQCASSGWPRGCEPKGGGQTQSV